MMKIMYRDFHRKNQQDATV